MGLDTRKGSAHLCRARVMLIPLVFLLLVSVPMIFADPTTVDIYWNGTDADIIYTFISGDGTSMGFISSGANILGEFHGIDYNDDPGGWGFDTFESRIKASFSGSVSEDGKIEFITEIIDSRYNSTFRPFSYTKIETDVSGYLGWKTITNYTHLLNFNSDDWETGYEIQASGDFEVTHEMFNPEDEGTSLLCEGLGIININLDKEWLTDSAFESGTLLGCNAVGTGIGEFTVYAYADNYLRGDLGYELPGGGKAILALEYKDGFTLADFGSQGD